MGCGGSSAKNTSDEYTDIDILKEPEDEEIRIEDTLDEYPKPKPAPNRKRQIFKPEDEKLADGRAREVRLDDVSSVEEVAEKLTKGLKSDVQQLRALFSWMGLQQISTRRFPADTGGNSLLSMMKMVKGRTLSYTTFFAILCRAANIPCVIIRGLGKSVAYEVGDQDVDDCTNCWNGVYVAGGWRFVFPLWAFSAISGFQVGKWTLVETEGEGVRRREESSEGITISQTNEYYFLTDPETFIYDCYPNNEEWQLLPQPFTKKQFIDVPYCRQAFFERNMKITSKNNCVLESEDGVCDISLKSVDNEDVTLTYRLYYNHKESRTPISDQIQLDRYVACMNQKNGSSFRIRFPCEGIFKIEIYGRFDNSSSSNELLCEFKLFCNEDVSNVNPFPCNPEAGFGPSAVTMEHGLAPQSHSQGFIHVQKEKNISVKFTMIKNVQVQALLVHNKISSEELQKYVEHKMVGKELNVNVNVPDSEEYALQINTRDKDSGGEFKNACNYLLSSENMDKEATEKKPKKKRAYENALEKRARHRLEEGLTSKNPDTIKRALDEFHKFELEDQDKEKKAEQKITYHTLARDLKDAINTRHIERLEKALTAAQSSEYEEKLSNLIENGQELLEHLRKLKRFSHDVLQMKQPTISEITNYKTPHPVAYDIMKSSYLLLGEKKHQLEEWEMITALMRKTGKKGLLRRVRNFDTVNVDKDTTNAAAKILKQYSEEQVKTTSVGIATFYVWGTNIVNHLISS